jgi:hypothetical protein
MRGVAKVRARTLGALTGGFSGERASLASERVSQSPSTFSICIPLSFSRDDAHGALERIDACLERRATSPGSHPVAAAAGEIIGRLDSGAAAELMRFCLIDRGVRCMLHGPSEKIGFETPLDFHWFEA